MSNTVNKGDFLHEKMLNMIRFVSEGTGVVIEGLEKQVTPVRAVLFCQEMRKHKLKIIHRDFLALHNIEDLPSFIQDAIVTVRKHPDLHDKFWRYMELFVMMGDENEQD